MANTSSLAWPNMFNIAQNRVSTYEDNQSVVSRCRLLMLTGPTELYNEPNQGVGLSGFLFRYNKDNVKAEICDKCKEQFRIHDPTVDAPSTQWANGLQFTAPGNDINMSQAQGHVKMTIAVKTIYGDIVNIDLNNEVNG